SAPVPLAFAYARFSASVRGRRRRFFSHAERYSGVPKGSSGSVLSSSFFPKERTETPPPFAILSRMPLRFSAAAISPARSSVSSFVSFSSASISSAFIASPRSSISFLIAARRASISLILIVLNLHHKFDFKNLLPALQPLLLFSLDHSVEIGTRRNIGIGVRRIRYRRNVVNLLDLQDRSCV